MRRIIIFIIALTAFLGSQAGLVAQRGKISGSYDFWMYTPDGESKTTRPLVIFLHGASLCGNNLEKVKRYGTIDAIEKGRKLDAYVIAPQNTGGAWKPSRVMEIIDWAEKNYNIDSNRIYVLGMSLGGYGTIDLAATYPDRIAAAIAICGGGTSKNLGNLNDVPLWIVHGTADRAVSISQSDKVVEQIKKVDNNTPRLIYDRVPGMNHSQPARMFYMPDIYDWLFAHSLSDPQRKVTDAIDINSEVLKGAYKGLEMRGRRSSVSGKHSSKSHSSKKRHSRRRG